MLRQFLFVVLMGAVLGTLVACRGTSEVRNFAVEELLLTAQELPPMWVLQGQYVTGCPAEKSCVRQIAALPLKPELAGTWQRSGTDGSIEDIFAEFDLIAADGTTVLVHGNQGVLLYTSPAIALSRYNNEVDLYQFSQSDVWEDTGSDVPFTSQYATKWRIGCSRESQAFKEKCLYYAVYDEFLVDLAWIVRDANSPAAINRNEFVELVITLDEKIGGMLRNTSTDPE